MMLTDKKTVEAKRRARQLWLIGCASILLGILVLATTGWTVYVNWSNSRRDAQIADANRVYLRSLNDILGALKDAETGQRGYILTGRAHYLLPYHLALQPIKKALDDLSAVSLSRPDQRAAIEHIRSLTKLKLVELAKTIDLHDKEGFNAALGEILTDTGSKAMDEIRSECKALADAQNADVVKRSGEAQKLQLDAIRLAGLGATVLMLLMVAGFIVLNSGAAQQARLAELLADSKEIFETTLTSIGDGVIATDTLGKITFINPEAHSLTGWTRLEAVGRHLDEVFQIVNESSRAKVESPFDKVMRTGIVAGLANHTILVRKDQSEVAIDDSGAPIRDVYGNINGTVLVFRNITERRKAETALEVSHGEVLKANEELRQFSYAATHDLQEPLRTIVVFSQLLARNHKQTLDERGRHLLQTVEEAAIRMSILIEHLLAYTRVGGMDSAANRVDVAANEALEDALIQLKGAIEETQAVIRHGELPHVWSEAAQLSQVFQNLISNAIKYRKPDLAPVIDVTSTIQGDLATFQVTDNGIGFKQEYADRIFLLFQRLHGRTIPGTGIGLALCRKIVERQGGRIWANSEENIGSCFYFTLPLANE